MVHGTKDIGTYYEYRSLEVCYFLYGILFSYGEYLKKNKRTNILWFHAVVIFSVFSL
jgi:EamA domain-containing membrane protein RarD